MALRLSDRDPGSQPPRRLFNPVYGFVAIIVALALVLAVVKVARWHHDRAPFGPGALVAHVTGLTVLTASDARASNVRAALRGLGDPAGRDVIRLPQGHRHRQYVVGRLDIAAHQAPAGSQYWLVIIDNRTHKLVSLSGDPVDGSSRAAGAGWDGGLGAFALKYPWLAPISEVRTDQGYQDPGETVSVGAGPTVSLPFVGIDGGDAMTTALTPADLTVALLMEGPDQQPWWAERLA